MLWIDFSSSVSIICISFYSFIALVYGECTMSYIDYFNFLWLCISRYKKMQAIKLITHVTKPIDRENVTPIFYFNFRVRNTFAISPISGKINVKPASFPIQLEDIFAWIIYKTSAVVPSNALPTMSIGKAYYYGLAPKMAMRSWPKTSPVTAIMSIIPACLSYMTPKGIMKKIATALGTE